MYIHDKSIFGAWRKLLNYIYKNGADFKDHRNLMCREVLNLCVEIQNPTDVTAPIKWLDGLGDWKYPLIEELANIILSKKVGVEYAFSYGPRIFDFQNKVDQINNYVIPILKKDSNSRRAMAIISDPIKDAKVENTEVPALVSVLFKVKNNQLLVTLIMRSNDMFFGWPANVFQVFKLQEYVAEQLKLDAGPITTFSFSAHIFEDQFEYVKKLLAQN
jgi:thymidylate synthase